MKQKKKQKKDDGDLKAMKAELKRVTQQIKDIKKTQKKAELKKNWRQNDKIRVQSMYFR